MSKQRFFVVLLTLVLTGCATKQYPQAAAVTPEETATLNCSALDQELVKAHSVQSDIDQTGQFDALTVLALSGISGWVMALRNTMPPGKQKNVSLNCSR